MRALQAIVRLIAGRAAAELIAALRQAETSPDALPTVDAGLDALPTIPRRRILATFAAMLVPVRTPP